VSCFVLVRKLEGLEEKGLQAGEANGRNDARTNASEPRRCVPVLQLRKCWFCSGYEVRYGRREQADSYEDKASRASGRASQEWGSRDPEEPTPTRESQP
jgi:hypothetical protein